MLERERWNLLQVNKYCPCILYTFFFKNKKLLMIYFLLLLISALNWCGWFIAAGWCEMYGVGDMLVTKATMYWGGDSFIQKV